MCGITGYSVGNGRLPRPDALHSSLRGILHRGPDDSGVFEDSSRGIGLAHARLSILDLSPSGHQPMTSGEDGPVLVYNGEVYNHHELRSGLLERGHSFKGRSDTEVILRLFEEREGSGSHWTEVLRSLNGIFALALWDPRSDELRIARDAMGVKPLYYAESSGRFFFASEIKALFPMMPGLKDLDPESIDRYLTYLWCPGDGTPLREVRKLEPGFALSVVKGRIVDKVRWHRPRLYIDSGGAEDEAAHSRPDHEWILGTRDRLRGAVHRQMVSDVPVGAFLSGGLDSSSIVAFARELNPGIRCFTIQASDWGMDEETEDLPFAKEAASHLGVPLDIVSIDSAKMAQDVSCMIEQLDEPLADPACLNVLYISRLARQAGIKVLLSGAGGDDILTGYRRHRALSLEGLWSGWPPFARSALQGLTSGLSNRSVLTRRVRKMFRAAAMDRNERLLDYFRWIDKGSLSTLYSPDFSRSLHRDSTEEPLRDFISSLPEGLHPIDRMLALDQRFFLADHNLLYTDKMSMAAGVEVRVPFLDLDFVDYAARMPWRIKQRGGEGKWVLKKAMEPILPKSLIYRSKTGFGAPLRRWIRFELRDLVGDILSEHSLLSRGIFNPLTVTRMIDENRKGIIDASHTILSMLSIELWCRRFLDGGIQSPSS